VRLDLTNTLVGQNHFNITSQNISLPPGIVLKGVTPHNVSVDLDLTIRKELPVQVDWTGRLPENLVLTEASVEPQRVEIVGSRRVLETLSTAYTERVYLDRLRENAGVLEAGLALQPGFKVAQGSSERVLIKYITRKRE
jgi:YbbR domain-containing protein